MYTSFLPQVLETLDAAFEAGLDSAAEGLQEQVKQDLEPGYTSGMWVTGKVVESVQRRIERQDRMSALVYSDVNYAWWWEVGHLNVFIDGPIITAAGVRTGPIRRKEVWIPALYGTGNEQLMRFLTAAQELIP